MIGAASRVENKYFYLASLLEIGLINNDFPSPSQWLLGEKKTIFRRDTRYKFLFSPRVALIQKLTDANGPINYHGMTRYSSDLRLVMIKKRGVAWTRSSVHGTYSVGSYRSLPRPRLRPPLVAGSACPCCSPQTICPTTTPRRPQTSSARRNQRLERNTK